VNKHQDNRGEELINRYPNHARLCAWLALAGLVLGSGGATLVGALAREPAFLVIPVIVGGTVLLTASIAGLTFRHYAPLVDRHLAEFRAGQHLAHWTYDPHEWREFAEQEWARAREEGWVIAVVLLALGALVGGFVWAVAGAGPAALGLGALIGGAGGYLVSLLPRSLAHRKYRRALRRVGETYLGREAVYHNGRYDTWATWGSPLTDVQLQEGSPTILELTIGAERTMRKVRVLVPAGQESEAREVIRALGGSPLEPADSPST
jgi:hypothetical protein